jgi:hypothetical protein
LHSAIRLVCEDDRTFEKSPVGVNPFTVNHASPSNNC